MIALLLACAGSGADPAGGDGGGDGGSRDGGSLDGGSLPVEALSLPWESGLEPAEGQDDLLDLGFWTPSLGEPGQSFALSRLAAAEGTYGALRPRATRSGAVLDDWLVLPALDLGEGPAMLLAQQRGAGTVEAPHELWISTQQRDPADGTYVRLAALPEPGEDWGELVVDLGEAGAATAWLAFRSASAGEDWALDLLRVQARTAWFVEPTLEVEPEPALPGDELRLTIELRNAVEEASGPLSLTLSLPEGGGALEPTAQVHPGVEALGTLRVEAALRLDADLSSPSRLPLDLVLEGEGGPQRLELELRVGPPSSAWARLRLAEAGAVALSLGKGPVDAPTLLLPWDAAWREAGEVEVDLDLLDQAASLPPVAGEAGRWFLRVQSTAPGEVLEFGIAHMGERWEQAEASAFAAGETLHLRLPAPPAPRLELLSSSPDPAAPGQEVELRLALRNEGAGVAGPVQVELEGEGEAVEAGPLLLAAEELAAGATVELPALRWRVPDDATDSEPLALRLRLDDGVDRFDLPFSLPVPWAVPVLMGARVEDGEDGRLSAGEAASLVLRLANAGDLDLGPQSLLLRGDGLEAVDGPAALSGLAVGEEIELRFEVQVEAAASGLALELLLSGGEGERGLAVELALDEEPWSRLALREDPAGDVLDPLAFDLRGGRYRVVDDRFELELRGAGAVEPAEVFLELWARPSVAITYSYLRVLLLDGEGRLEGYASPDGFRAIGEVEVEAPAADTLRLSWSVEAMDLYVDALSLGLGAGWCGPPDYYCDHHPDGWGYPYASWSRAGWFSLSW